MWFLTMFWRVFRGFWRLLVGLIIGTVLYIWLFFYQKEYWEKIHAYTHDFTNWVAVQPMFSDYSQWSTLLHLDEKLAFALFILVGRMVWMLLESVFLVFPYWLMFGRKKKPVEGRGAVRVDQTSSRTAGAAAAAVPVSTSGADAEIATGTPLPGEAVPIPAPAQMQEAPRQQQAPREQQVRREERAPREPRAPREERPPRKPRENVQAPSLEAALQKAKGLQAAAPAAAAPGKLTEGLGDLEQNAEHLERSIDEALKRIRQVKEQKPND